MDEIRYPYINSLQSAGNASLTVKGIVRVRSTVWRIRRPRYDVSTGNSFPSAWVKVRTGLGIVGLKALKRITHSLLNTQIEALLMAINSFPPFRLRRYRNCRTQSHGYWKRALERLVV